MNVEKINPWRNIFLLSGDRGQIVERSLNHRTGREERKEDLINMEDRELN
jgi:hypothetical protein